MRLTINMRALNDSWFYDFLLRVGDGTEESINDNFIRIPDDMTIPFTSKENSTKELFKAIFPSIENSVCTLDYIASREILSTRNESVDEINDQMIDNFQGEEMVYYSFDEVEDDKNNFYPTEFLNSLNVSGLPPHKLRLKIGCPMILIRNIDPSRGLCNGTRLTRKGFHRNSIDAEIAAGQHSGEREAVMDETQQQFEALSVSKPAIEDVAMQEANIKETEPAPNVSTKLEQPPCESSDNMFANDKWWLENQDEIIRICEKCD
ncbi:uncharacterized protein LOC143557290 [Bidens hawaiensis]|uniref:uncharacterized protein LOC143557290 n=1 Tax=Bidens hawaiensis TaxID=980011 RepID=UPI00404A1146